MKQTKRKIERKTDEKKRVWMRKKVNELSMSKRLERKKDRKKD